jgi:hypothetical protein
MTPFPRLRRALQALEHERKLAQRDLVRAEEESAALAEEVRRAEEHLAGILGASSDDVRLDAALRQTAHHSGQRVRAELRRREDRARAHRAEVAEPARERLLDTSVHARSVESLLERRLEEHEAARLAAEGRTLDESGQARWVRRSAPG